MLFKTFFESEEKKDQDYINSLIANLHLDPKLLVKAYASVPQIVSNFKDKSEKRLNSLNAVIYHLSKNLKGGEVTVLTPDGDKAVTYTKDIKPIFNNKGNKRNYAVSRQDILNMLTQGMPSASPLGGSAAAGGGMPSLGGIT